MEETKIEGEKKEKMSWGRIMILLLLVINLCFMAGLLYYVVGYTEELSSDPLIYGANKFNIQSCDCVTYSLKELHFNNTNVWTVTRLNGSKTYQVVNSTLNLPVLFKDGTS